MRNDHLHEGPKTIQASLSKPLASFYKDVSRTQQSSLMSNRNEKVSLPEIIAYNANRIGMKNMSIITDYNR